MFILQIYIAINHKAAKTCLKSHLNDNKTTVTEALIITGSAPGECVTLCVMFHSDISGCQVKISKILCNFCKLSAAVDEFVIDKRIINLGS